MELSFALTSIFLLIVYHKLAFKLGFTKDILSRVTLNEREIDGKEHVFNLHGFNAYRISDNITKILGIQLIIFVAIIILNVFLLNIKYLVTIMCGVLFPLFVLWIYLLAIAEEIKAMKVGTTTIEVIP